MVDVVEALFEANRKEQEEIAKQNGTTPASRSKTPDTDSGSIHDRLSALASAFN